MRVIAILSNTAMLIVGMTKFKLPFGYYTLYDIVLMGIIALFFIGFIVITLLKAHQLSEEDTVAVQKKK